MSILHFTADNFEKEAIQSNVPVVIDFWADWCGPCQMFGPIFEEVSGEFEGRAKFGKVNVDEQMELARKYRILSIPTVAVLKNGELVDRVTGAMEKDELKHLVDKNF